MISFTRETFWTRLATEIAHESSYASLRTNSKRSGIWLSPRAQLTWTYWCFVALPSWSCLAWLRYPFWCQVTADPVTVPRYLESWHPDWYSAVNEGDSPRVRAQGHRKCKYLCYLGLCPSCSCSSMSWLWASSQDQGPASGLCPGTAGARSTFGSTDLHFPSPSDRSAYLNRLIDFSLSPPCSNFIFWG